METYSYVRCTISLSLFYARRHGCVRARRWREPNKINIHRRSHTKSVSLFTFSIFVRYLRLFYYIYSYLFSFRRDCLNAADFGVIAKYVHTLAPLKTINMSPRQSHVMTVYLSQLAQSYIMKNAKLLQYFDNR